MKMIPQNSPIADTQKQSLELISQIARWFNTAVPNPSSQNARAQLGMHFEEVFEMVQVLGAVGATDQSCKQLTFAADVLSYFQRQIKSSDLEMTFDKVDRAALLDVLCDQIDTALGVAHMHGMNIEGALKEIVISNDSKFGNDGQPIFNTQRKIKKGPNYQGPDLAPYASKRWHSDA